MIVPMKKVTILCLASEKEQALKKIRALGVLHVEVEQLADSNDRAELQTKLNAVEKAAAALESRNGGHAPSGDVSAENLFRETDKLMAEASSIDKELESLRRSHEALSPWGDFSQDLVKELEAKGVFVYLCQGPEKQYLQFCEKDDIVCHEVSLEKGEARFVIVAREELKKEELPLAQVPDNTRLKSIESHMTKLERRRGQINDELTKLAVDAPVLGRYKLEIAEHIEFLTNRDSMSDHEKIASITGFIPEPDMDEVSKAAKKDGWALLIQEPDIDKDRIPTLIKLPKMFRLIQPLFDFLGIAPGYHEIDVSVGVLFFFTIFFGMIIGDAGYGSVFLLLTLLFSLKLRKNPKAKLPLCLMGLLSVTTMVWGGLSGNWFGLSAPGIKWLTDPATKNANIMFFCFILAVAQLSLGHIWRAIVYGKWTKFLGQAGWMLILWGNFFLTLKLIVFPGTFPVVMYWLYGIGFALVVFFDVDWLSPSEAFNFPFSVIGSFVDMLSYIRLFAVGMSGYYIATSFNGMGGNLLHLSAPGWVMPLTIIIGIVVILFGHLLNIALCLMGVLVHGVRLNTLEFSNHIGLTWSGIEFKPFKKENLNEGDNNHGS